MALKKLLAGARLYAFSPATMQSFLKVALRWHAEVSETNADFKACNAKGRAAGVTSVQLAMSRIGPSHQLMRCSDVSAVGGGA